MKKKISILPILTILLLCVTSIMGMLSMNFSKGYDVTNQYDTVVKIFGNGIYAHDSYFKAPILIGTDICILLVLVPLFIYTYKNYITNSTIISRVKLTSIYAVALYYAASISFGVTYNRLHLVYIALLACSLFGMFSILRTIRFNELNYELTKGNIIFLLMAGIALVIAWMPDIIPTVVNGTPLSLIEVYTTEVTYVLDMGIIGPLCLVCLYLLRQGDKLGILIFAILLKICIIVGIMMIPQTICQVLSGYEVVLPVLIGKPASFVVLGGFALYFNKKLYSKL